MEFHKNWIEQCEASIGIKERYGVEKALGYLIGEKLFFHLEMVEKDDLWAQEIIPFCAEIKNLYDQWELRNYLDNVKRTGPAGHVMSDEDYEEVGHKIHEYSVVQAAQNIFRLEKIRTLLLEN